MSRSLGKKKTSLIELGVCHFFILLKLMSTTFTQAMPTYRFQCQMLHGTITTQGKRCYTELLKYVPAFGFLWKETV